MSPNPFLSIWLQPKATFEHFIESKSVWHSLFMATLAGISSFIFALHQSGWHEDFSAIFFACLIMLFGTSWGIMVWSFSAYACTVVGRFYGGTGTSHEMAIAIGPMVLPQVFLLPVYLLYIAGYRQQFFAAPDPYAFSSLPTFPYVVLILLLAFSLFWMLVIASKGIGVVHNFSAWLGFAVIITIIGFTMLCGLAAFFGILFLFY